MVSVGTITKLDAVTFDDLLRQQDPFGDPGCLFRLGRATFISPAGMVQLAAACYGLYRIGRQPVINLSNGSGMPTFLLRANFESVVNGIVRFDPPFKREFLGLYNSRLGTNPLLIEVTKLELGSELPALLDRIVDALRDELHYPKEAAFDVAIAISEAGQNTFDHNGQTCGFIAMQVYGRQDRPFLEIGISDCGDGLITSLQRNPNTPPFNSDQEAIAYATQAGTSEFSDPTRGQGLCRLIEIAFRYGGSVQIRSDAGVVRFRMDRRQGWAFSVPLMPGVHIALTLPGHLAG